MISFEIAAETEPPNAILAMPDKVSRQVNCHLQDVEASEKSLEAHPEEHKTSRGQSLRETSTPDVQYHTLPMKLYRSGKMEYLTEFSVRCWRQGSGAEYTRYRNRERMQTETAYNTPAEFASGPGSDSTMFCWRPL